MNFSSHNLGEDNVNYEDKFEENGILVSNDIELSNKVDSEFKSELNNGFDSHVNIELTKEDKKGKRPQKRQFEDIVIDGDIIDDIERDIVDDIERDIVDVNVNIEKTEKRRKVKKLPPMPKMENIPNRVIYGMPPRNPEFLWGYDQLVESAKKQKQDNYLVDLQEYEIERKEYLNVRKNWLAEVLENEKGIPYDQRTKASLERDLEFRGLETSGLRDVLIKRLKIHDKNPQDPSLIKRSMKVVQKVTNVSLFSEHQPQVFGYGSGEYGIVGLPHGIIEKKLLALFDVLCPDDYYALHGLLLSCKYLQEDVIKYLAQESIRIFGNGGTPLALNCFFKTVWFKQKLFRTTDEVRRGVPKYKFAAKGKKVTLAKTQKQLGLENWYNKNVLPSQIDKMRKATDNFEMVKNAIIICIKIYGSVEGYMTHLEKTRQVKINRVNDRLVTLEGAHKRADMFNLAINNMGYPNIIKCSGSELSTNCEAIEIEVWEYLSFGSRYGDRNDLFNYVKGHIMSAKPALLKTVLAKFPVEFPDYVRRIENLSGVKINVNLYGNSQKMAQFMYICKNLFLPKSPGDPIKWFGQYMTKDLLDKQFSNFVKINWEIVDKNGGIGDLFRSQFGYGYYPPSDNLFVVFGKDLSILPIFNTIPIGNNGDLNVDILLSRLNISRENIIFKHPVTGSEIQSKIVFAKII